MNWVSNLPLFFYLLSIPLVSAGTTSGQESLTWIGFLFIISASLITPTLRLRGNVRETGPSTQYDQPESDEK